MKCVEGREPGSLSPHGSPAATASVTHKLGIMSKKNNLGTRKRIHDADLRKEKEDRAKREAIQKKKQEALKAGGIQKEKKTKAIRIRKGVKIMGVKIKDAESKKKAIKLMKISAAQKMDEGTSSKPLRGRRGVIIRPGSAQKAKITPAVRGLGVSKGGVDKKPKKLTKAKERRLSSKMFEQPTDAKPIDTSKMQT